jgi:AraC family transcriptional regulator of adaptative response/methylated-DNA-[protein]-cysteine methyltransferase
MDQYSTIAKALGFIQDNYRNQPSLEAIATHVELSPFHLQRLFTEWAGVSPKKFLQYLSIERAKELLQKNSVLDTTYKIGLSGTSRLHDLFMTIEGMTPGEYKNGGAGLTIYYSLKKSLFGNYLVASTNVGVCNILFYDNVSPPLTKGRLGGVSVGNMLRSEPPPTPSFVRRGQVSKSDDNFVVAELQRRWPKAQLINKETDSHRTVQQFFNHELLRQGETIKLHLKGTPFQLKVWEALLRIPEGKLTSYGSVAQSIAKPTAQRAVGSAIGDNPVAYLIPCHRVIKNNGMIGGYRWRAERKLVMIGWEGVQSSAK